MKPLSAHTEHELRAELDRRKLAEIAPKPIAKPDFAKFAKFVNDSLQEAVKMGRCKDFDHYVYEEAMTTIYGEDFFKWFNQSGLGE